MHSSTDQSMDAQKPLRISLESSVGAALREIVTNMPTHFQIVENDQADVIIFENDNPGYIRLSAEFKKWPKKCVVVSESDLPTYFLPGCYASNEKKWLSGTRIKTISYILSQRSVPNPFIKDVRSDANRTYLYSFQGGATSWVRKKLFKNPPKFKDVLIQESNQYRHWNFEADYTRDKLFMQKKYAELLEQSSFFLCPRGAGASSIRLFEVMQAGRVPVIIADNWVPIDGIPWSEFSLFIPENRIAELDRLIRAHQSEAQKMGTRAREVWHQFFAPGVEGILVAESLKFIHENRNEKKEKLLRSCFPILEIGTYVKHNLRSTLRYVILQGYSLLGMKFPYSLNRPATKK